MTFAQWRATKNSLTDSRVSKNSETETVKQSALASEYTVLGDSLFGTMATERRRLAACQSSVFAGS